VVIAETTVGVPLTIPVLGLMTKPVGRAGLTLYEVTVPPPLVGLSGVIATPMVSTNEPAV
jgi:hypothetical protein